MAAGKLLLAKAGGDGKVVERAVQEMGLGNVSIFKKLLQLP